MASVIGVNSAVGWVHFRVRGGWRRVLTTAGVYAAIIVGSLMLSLKVEPKAMTSVLEWWTYGLLAIQGVVLLFVGSGAIRNGIQKDVTTKMLESHRLMPISAVEAVGGYALGGTVQAMVIGVVNLFLGSATAMGGGYAVGDWLRANAILLLFALCFWVATVFFSFISKAGYGALIALVIMGTTSGGAALAFLPGLLVPVSPMIGGTLFGVLLGKADWGWEYQVSAVVGLVGAGICYVGAVRKYRRDDVEAFGPIGGLLILAIWLASSWVAIAYWGAFEPRFWRGMNPGRMGQLVGSLAGAMVVSLLPISSAAWGGAQWLRRRGLRDPGLGKRPVPMVAAIAAAVALCLVFCLAVMRGRDDVAGNLARTGVALAAFMVSVGFVYGAFYRVRAKPGLVVGIWVVLWWLGPIFADVVRAGLGQLVGGEVLGVVAGCSPVGALVLIWGEWEASSTLGLVVQVWLAALPAGLYAWVASRKRQRR